MAADANDDGWVRPDGCLHAVQRGRWTISKATVGGRASYLLYDGGKPLDVYGTAKEAKERAAAIELAEVNDKVATS